MASLFRNKFVIIGIIVVVLGVIWYVFSSSSSSSSSIITSEAGNDIDPELVQTLLVMHSVTLTSTILSNPAFVTLKDFSSQIVPEPVGRDDPFAVLPANTSATPATTQSAHIFISSH